MPTYEYKCEKCGHFEFSQRITEDALKTCPTCNGAVERLISASAFHLKGGGWYKTDYASSAGNKDSSSTTPATTGGETKSEAPKSEATPAAAPAPSSSTSNN